MKKLFLLTLLALSSATSNAADAKPASTPNILFIAVDDLRDWVGYLHHNAQTITPNIDKLAARGVAFTHSYCAAPVCNPSRTALMSGLRPFSSGVYENDDDWRKVIAPELTLNMHFKKNGYETLGAGKIYHESYSRHQDWDDYLDESKVKTGKKGKAKIADADGGVGGIKFAPLDCADADMQDYHIVDYGIEQLGKKHDKPFFLAVGVHKPHMPWNVPKKYYDMHPLDKIELPPYLKNDLDDVPPSGVAMAKPQGDHKAIIESGRWKDAIQGYLAATTFCDTMIGRLMDAFDKSEYKDNTIVVFWCDHGWHLGEKDHWRKFALWENTTRAPLLWIVPGMTKPNSVCERTVDFMTVYPTLCDLCGIETPKHVEGTSIKHLLSDPKAAWDKPGITTYEYNNHAIRGEGWRYIRYNNGDEELYDETKDPEEWKNLAGDSNFNAKKEELAKWLPKQNKDDMNGNRGFGIQQGTDGKKAAKKKMKQEAK